MDIAVAWRAYIKEGILVFVRTRATAPERPLGILTVKGAVRWEENMCCGVMVWVELGSMHRTRSWAVVNWPMLIYPFWEYGPQFSCFHSHKSGRCFISHDSMTPRILVCSQFATMYIFTLKTYKNEMYWIFLILKPIGIGVHFYLA